jgi:hypothetical protein
LLCWAKSNLTALLKKLAEIPLGVSAIFFAEKLVIANTYLTANATTDTEGESESPCFAVLLTSITILSPALAMLVYFFRLNVLPRTLEISTARFPLAKVIWNASI